MRRWTRTALVAAFLAGGILAGLGLGRAFDPDASAHASSPRVDPPAALLSLQDSFANVAAAVSPSVVHITLQGSSPWEGAGIGSGVLVSPDGHVITNHHVVDAGGRRLKVKVRFVDGREFPATVVGTDSETDLALLKIDPQGGRLPPPMAFADSDKVRVGDWCLAIGSPFGYNHSVTVGIVSAKHRRATLAQAYQDFIQTDAAINPGNSGGALVNLRGELIGINTAIASETRGSDGVGFAIPSRMVGWVKDSLLRHHSVKRGFLGVSSLDFGPALDEFYRENYGIASRRDLLDQFGIKEPRGVVILEVTARSPAGQVGIRPHDVLVEFNGAPVSSQTDLLFRVAEMAPKTPAVVKVVREGKELEFRVELGERPPLDLRKQGR